MWDPPMSSKALSVSRPTGAFIFYRKPEEWGEVIYVWVRAACPPFYFTVPSLTAIVMYRWLRMD